MGPMEEAEIRAEQAAERAREGIRAAREGDARRRFGASGEEGHWDREAVEAHQRRWDEIEAEAVRSAASRERYRARRAVAEAGGELRRKALDVLRTRVEFPLKAGRYVGARDLEEAAQELAAETGLPPAVASALADGFYQRCRAGNFAEGWGMLSDFAYEAAERGHRVPRRQDPLEAKLRAAEGDPRAIADLIAPRRP